MTEKILEIDNLTVSFDGFKALNNLNFSMKPGELRVIIGPNGAGKTTLQDVITGRVKPTQGNVYFKGRSLVGIPEHKIARLGIGRKFQTPRVYLNLTVQQNLDLACNRNKNLLSTLWGKVPSGDQRKVSGLLETIGLTPKANLSANLLSHGEKQRLEIGMLVAQSPELLLVDEPVAGLTDEETENIGDLLLALAESHSIIVIEHDMEFVRQIAKTVTVLHQGTLLCEGTMEQVQNDPRVIEVYLGKAPSISSQQLKILRIVAAMAWSDGYFSTEEMDVILSRLSQEFTEEAMQQEELKLELRDYLSQTFDVESLIAEIEQEKERELILKLSYEVIKSSARTPDEELVNEEEAEAYNKLIELLNIPVERVKMLEEEVDQELILKT